MTCQECELLLADGEAGASADDHLRGCADCRTLQKELRANALALSALRDDELARVTTSKRRPVLPWIAAAAAAILLALILHRSPHPQHVTPPVPGPIKVTAQLPPAPALKPAVRRRRKPAHRNAQPEQPLLVKMLTPDPDVVVYWLVD
jgi:hypothetical protein